MSRLQQSESCPLEALWGPMRHSEMVNRSSGKHDANRRWAQIAWKMNFSKEQLSEMLTVRTDHLERLRGIYEDRRQVNLEAISVLVRPFAGTLLHTISNHVHISSHPMANWSTFPR